MNGSSGVPMWIILGATVLIIAMFFIYSALKDRIMKNRKKKQKIKTYNKVLESQRKLIFTFYALWKINQEKLDNFVPSVGQYKMSFVVDTAKKYLANFGNDEFFKTYLIDIDAVDEYVHTYTKLSETRSNSWDKKLPEVKDFIFNKYESYSQDLYATEYKEIENKISQFYEDELKHNLEHEVQNHELA